MSFQGLLTHRMTVKHLEIFDVDGIPAMDWRTVSTGEHCRVDLSFIRSGKDPQWTPEAGRPADRTGVLYVMPASKAKVGDRLVFTLGPRGTFLVEGVFEEILGRKGTVDHLEIGIREVAPAIASGSV